MGRIINIIKITDNSGLIDILTDHLRDADSPLSFQKIIPEPNDPMRFPEGISEAQRRAWRSYAWGTPDEPTHVAMNLLRYDNDETSYRYVFTTNDYPPSADLIQGISNMVPRPQWAGSLKIETTAYDPKSETVRIQRWKNDEMVDQVVDKMTDDEQRFIQQYDDGVYDNYYAVFRRDGDKVKASDVINDIEIKFRYKQDNYAIRNAVESETSDFDFNKIVPEPKTLTEDNQQERLIWRGENWGSTSNAKDAVLAPAPMINILRYQFKTENYVPTEILKKLSEKFPSVTIYHTALYPNAINRFDFEYQSGNEISSREHVMTEADKETIREYEKAILDKASEIEDDRNVDIYTDDKDQKDLSNASTIDEDPDEWNLIIESNPDNDNELIYAGDAAYEYNLTTPEESHNLWIAGRIEKLAEEYDPYDFDDSLDFVHNREARLLEQKKLLETGDIEAIREYLQMIVEDPEIQGRMKIEAMDLLTTLDNPQIYDQNLQDKESLELAERIDNVLFDSDPEKYINVYGSRQNGRFAFYSVLNEPEIEKVTETYQYVVTTLRDVMQDPDISYRLWNEATDAYQTATEFAKAAGLELSFLDNHLGEEAAYELQNGKYMKLTGDFSDYKVTIYGKSFKPEETRAVHEHTIIEAVNNVISSRPGYEIKEQIHTDWLFSKTDAAETHTARLQDRFEAFLRKDGNDNDRGPKI